MKLKEEIEMERAQLKVRKLEVELKKAWEEADLAWMNYIRVNNENLKKELKNDK